MPINENGEYVSKYTFHEEPNGFRISAPERTTVGVYINEEGTGFAVRNLDRKASTLWLDESVSPGLYVPFPDYYKLSKVVCALLLSEWQRPEEKKAANPMPMFDIHGWMVQKTGRGIGARLYAQFKRLQTLVNPTILAAQKAAFRATMGGGEWHLLAQRGFYEEYSMLVRDIIQYRAAAVLSVYYGWAREGLDYRDPTPHRGLHPE